MQADPAGASLLGAFDVRASGATVDGFDVTHAGNMSYTFRVEGAGITISDNVIDAAGADGFRVRDAWSSVPGGGSATISANEIRDAAIGIGVDGDGQKYEYEVVTDLVISGNTIADNGTGIYYAASAESTMTVTNNVLLAGTATSEVYVEDATDPDGLADADPLDLEAILAPESGNTYTPEGEILGRKIVPIDPTHEPSMVRVVEHGTGTGKQYSIVEYTRGVAWTTDTGSEVGSQFLLDRGTETTPNRIGVNVEAYAPGMIKITWDGNPSFPNEITYIEHAEPQYRIHNEHELDGGGFTDALSPDLVGSPFPKPEDELVSGAVYFDAGGVTVDGQTFTHDQAVTDVDLSVSVASRSEPATLSLWFDGARPGEGFIAGETICSELLTETSCTTIMDALVANDGFIDNTTFLTDAVLTVSSDAAAGDWQLRWWVVETTTGEAYFSDTFTITIAAAE